MDRLLEFAAAVVFIDICGGDGSGGCHRRPSKQIKKEKKTKHKSDRFKAVNEKRQRQQKQNVSALL